MAGKMEPEAQSSEARFACYVDTLGAVLGREDRARPLKDYCTGLLMPGERKSVDGRNGAPTDPERGHKCAQHGRPQPRPSPLRLDQEFEVGVRVREVGRSSVTFDLGVFRKGDPSLFATSEIVWVNTNQMNRETTPVSESLRNMLILRDVRPTRAG